MVDTSNYSLHADEALAFIVQNLKHNPDAYRDSGGDAYDVWLPTAVWQFLVSREYPRIRQAEYRMDQNLKGVWRAFYDACWRLCRMGVFRPSASWSAVYRQGSATEDGYSYTEQGREWLKSSDMILIPSDPARYTNLLAKEAVLLGTGFLQRAREAASCHQTQNYLACCAMCGAAAESTVLAAAVAKLGDEARVLREYARPNGRRKVLKMIFGSEPSELNRGFVSSAFNLLAYWRDEAAHGQVSSITELDAFHALTTLLRLAQFVFSNWAALTSRDSG